MGRFLLLVFLLSLMVPVAARAQSIGTPLGDIYMSASEDYYLPSLHVGRFENFNWYVVVEIDFADIGLPEEQETNGIKGWEASVTVPPEIVVLGRVCLPSDCDYLLSRDNFIVGTGQVVRASSTPYAVVAYTGMLFQDGLINLYLTLSGSEPSSFTPPVPGWVEFYPTGECSFEDGTPKSCLRPFANEQVGEGNLWINQIIDPVTQFSWGSVKAQF